MSSPAAAAAARGGRRGLREERGFLGALAAVAAYACARVVLVPRRAAPLVGGSWPAHLLTSAKDNLRWSARARAGYADGRTLYYLTGGVVNGTSTVRQDYWALSAPNAPVADYFNIQRFGWSAGAGVEYAFTNNISAKLEYLYVGLGSQNQIVFDNVKFSTNIVRGGINLHF